MSDSFLGEIEEKLRSLFVEAERVRSRPAKTTKEWLKRDHDYQYLQNQICALQKFQQFSVGDWVKKGDRHQGQVAELMLNGLPQIWVRWLDGEELFAVPVPEQPELLELLAKCRSCQSPIYWGETAAGKKCPFNPDGSSHFATCPDARSWSRKAKQPDGQLELSFESCSSNIANSLGESEDSAKPSGNGTQIASSQPPTATSMKMRSPFTVPTSPTCQSTETSAPITHTGENLTSSPADSPAPEHPTQASAPASSIQSQNFGAKDCESCAKSVPATLSGSNLWELSDEDYEQSLEDAEWQAIVGSLSRSAPPNSEPATGAIASSLLIPTLTTGSGSYRNSGQTKCERRLKQLGVIPPGCQFSPEGMAALMEFPLDWFAVLTGKCYRNGATVSRTDSESATMCEDSQPLQLPPPKPRSPSKESKRARKTPNISPTKNDGCNISPTKTLAISFGKTSDRLHQKTVTRRLWTERRAKTFIRYFHEGRSIPALSKDRRYGGKQIGTLTLTEAPYKECLRDMPASDLATEGFPELTKEQFIERFFDGDCDRVVWVVRFNFEPLPQNISPTKTQEDENLRAQPNISQQKKGRKKGSSNRKPASGSLSPTVQVKKGKTYPIVQGERVDKDLAYDYPDQFVWLYNWGIQDADGCWKNRSKRVPVSKVYSVRHAIKAHKPVEEVLQIIDSNS